MSGARFPADLEVTPEHFANSGWREAIDGAKREGYEEMWRELSRAAEKMMEAGKTAEGKVLWLLADACSMKIKPERHNEPFDPRCYGKDFRSALPVDFTDADMQFFDEVVVSVDDPWLRGRLADLVWLCAKQRNPQHALMAIDAYREMGLDALTWIRGSRDCWGRAIRLARMLGDGAGDRLDEIRDAVLKAFFAASSDDGYLGLWLSDLLADHRLVGRDDFRQIADHLKQLANDLERAGDVHRYRDYFDRAARWYLKDGDSTTSADMTVAFAEGFVREAELRANAEKPSFMAAAHWYEQAVQVYRKIPQSERPRLKANERIDELRSLLNEAGEKSHDEMSLIAVDGPDMSEIIQQVKKAMRGKGLTDALGTFSNLDRVRVETIRDMAVEMINNSVLMGIMPATMVSTDGRIIAKQPGISLGGPNKSDGEDAIWMQMLQCYNMVIGEIALAKILPARDALMQEHQIQEGDFERLCMMSPLIPKDRSRLWGKALSAGYDGDFVTAIHLLCPQIEHMVRTRLKDAGAHTTFLSKEGIQTENGLSTLMAMSEAERVLGPNLSFEIKALFCSAFGSNLRNEVAHGLISIEECHSVQVIYAWWLGFRLVFNTYWRAKEQADEATATEDSTPPEETD